MKLRRTHLKTTIELTPREVLDLYLILYSYLDGPGDRTENGRRTDVMAGKIKDFISNGKPKE